MIADAHLHLFSGGYRGFAGPSPLGCESDVDAYERLRTEHGIGLGLVVGYEAGGIDPANNAFLRQLAKTRPWIASLAYVEVSPAPAPARIASLLAAGHCGLAVYLPDAAAGKAFACWPAEIWERLNEARAVISLNAVPEATNELIRVVEICARCAVLFSHLGLPGPYATRPSQQEAAERLAPLLALSATPAAGVKLSGLYAIDPDHPHERARPFLDLLVDRFGAENCHWGSDFSPALERVSFEQTLPDSFLSQLSSPLREKIRGASLLKKLQSTIRFAGYEQQHHSAGPCLR